MPFSSSAGNSALWKAVWLWSQQTQVQLAVLPDTVELETGFLASQGLSVLSHKMGTILPILPTMQGCYVV